MIYILFDIQFFVRLCYELCSGHSSGGADRTAGAYRNHRYEVCTLLAQRVDFILDLSIYFRIILGYQHKLITAVPRTEAVHTIREIVQSVRNELKSPVTYNVTELVIDKLKVVDVYYMKPELFFL